MDNIYYYEYIVKYYDEIYDADMKSTGIVAGESVADATLRLTDYYGDDNVLSLLIKDSGKEDVYPLVIDGLEEEFSND